MHYNDLATVQVDVDGLWVLEKLVGRVVALEPDSLIEHGLARILKLFDEFGIKATFFVVSRDLESVSKIDLLQRVSSLGHEIASHGISHNYLTAMTVDEAGLEITKSKNHLESVLGVKVNGFRAAGFACHKEGARLLEEAGYSYDSSVIPTSCAMIMESVSKVRYPKSSMLFAPTYPYRPSREDIYRKGDAAIMEIPVTVLPIFKIPCHLSYMIIGGRFYEIFSVAMFKTFKPKVLNYLFHPLDFVDSSSVQIDGNVPGLNIPVTKKLDYAKRNLDFICSNYQVMTTDRLANVLSDKE